MKSVLIGVLVCSTLLVSLVVYCSSGSAPAIEPVELPWTRPLAERGADPFPRDYIHPSGERVAIPALPRATVSGTIFSDAVLLAICPPERVRALHKLSTDARYSPVVAESVAFGRHHSGGSEEILALAPDLVVVSAFSRKETRDLLSKNDCAVLRFEGFDSLADIQNNIRALGYALDLDEEAEELVREMQADLDAVAANKSKRAAWRVLHYEMGRAAGADTTFDDMLGYVGAQNAALDLGITGSRDISPERVLVVDPDVVVLMVPPGQEEVTARRFAQLPGFESLRAVKNERLLFVPSAWLQSTSHHAAKAVQHMAEVLDRWGRP